MNDQPAAETSTVDTEPKVASTTVSQPEDWAKLAQEYKEQRDTYQNRFTGLQGKYQQELAKWNDSGKELTSKVSSLEAEIAKVTGEKEGSETQLTALQTDYEQASSDLEITKSQLGRLRIITDQFPDLLKFEGKSLLPDGNGDELVEQLTSFREMLGEQGKKAAADLIEGITPPAKAKEVDKNAQDYWTEALSALQAGEPDEHNRLMDLFYEAGGPEEK